MRGPLRISILAGLWVANLVPFVLAQEPRSTRPTLEDKLDTRIEHFDNSGRSLIDGVLELVYRYQLPTGIEYLDREAVRRPLTLGLDNKSRRETLAALVAQVPTYRISFWKGVVQIYSPQARRNPSNLLNVVVDHFNVNGRAAGEADAELAGTLIHKLEPRRAIFYSIAPSGPKITLHLQNARVYQILDTIAAQGNAIWTVKVPPEKLSSLERRLWYTYSLEPELKHVVREDLQNLFAPEKQPDPH